MPANNEYIFDQILNVGVSNKKALEAIINAKSAKEFRQAIYENADAFGITDPTAKAEFLAQVNDETIITTAGTNDKNSIAKLMERAAVRRVGLALYEMSINPTELVDFIHMTDSERIRNLKEDVRFGIKDYDKKDELTGLTDSQYSRLLKPYAYKLFSEQVKQYMDKADAIVATSALTAPLDLAVVSNLTLSDEFLKKIKKYEEMEAFFNKIEHKKYPGKGAKGRLYNGPAPSTRELTIIAFNEGIKAFKQKIIDKQEDLITLMKENQAELTIAIQDASKVTDPGLLLGRKDRIDNLIKINNNIEAILATAKSDQVTDAKKINTTAVAYTQFIDARIAVNNYLTADSTLSVKLLNDRVTATSNLIDTDPQPDFKTVIQPKIIECCTKLEILQARYRDIEASLKDAAIKQVDATREAADKLLEQMKRETIQLENAIYELRGKAALIYRANFIADKKDFLGKKPVSIQGPETAKAVSYDPRLMMQTKSAMEYFKVEVVEKKKIAAEGATRTHLADLGAKGGAGAFVAGDQPVSYKGVVLEENKVIRAVADVGPDKKGNERILVIEKYRNGITIDKIDDATYKTLNPAQKLQVALEQAKMLLADYPTHGSSRPPIVISSGDEKRVKLFHAVLLVLLQDTEKEIKIENWVLNKKGKIKVPEMAGKSHEEKNEKFIKSQLSKEERDRIAPDRNEFRHLVNVERNKTSEYRAILSEVQEAKNTEADEYLKNKLNASDEEEISFNRSTARPTL